jgi:hypothetical protein
MIAEYNVSITASTSMASHVDVNIRTIRQFSSYGYGLALTAAASHDRAHAFVIDVGGITLPQVTKQDEGPATGLVTFPAPARGEVQFSIRRKTDVVECVIQMHAGKPISLEITSASPLFEVEPLAA